MPFGHDMFASQTRKQPTNTKPVGEGLGPPAKQKQTNLYKTKQEKKA